jgi:hypothetical protein
VPLFFKTSIIHKNIRDTNLKFKFNFLGFTVMQRFIGKYKVKRSKLALPFVTHIIPSAESIKKHKQNLKECFIQFNVRSRISFELLKPQNKRMDS